MKFNECLEKSSMILNRVHSTSKILPIRLAIKEALNTPEDDIPNIVDNLVYLLTNYCVSETETNSVRQVLEILYNMEENSIKPKDLIEDSLNVLESGHFLKYPELLSEYSVGDSVWYYNGEILNETPFVERLNIFDSEINVIEGNSHSLYAEMLPMSAIDKETIWESSNEDVATVDSSGMVDSVGGGTCTITCKYMRDETIFDTCICNVIPQPKQINVDKILSAEPSAPNIFATATVLPENSHNTTVYWTSSNTDIATVNSTTGEITFIRDGIVKIIGTTINGLFGDTGEIDVYYRPSSVNLTPTSLSLEVDESSVVSATVLPTTARTKTVTWESATPSVATVNNGSVTGVSIGSSVVTCKTVDGNKTNNLTVTVTPKPTSVSVNKVTESEIGKTLQLTATVLPENVVNKTVTWETSDANIATVSPTGLVTFKNVIGNVTITAKTRNNLTDNTGVISVYSVPTSVAITQQNQTLEATQTLQLTATVLPENARNKNVTWESATLGVATVSPTGLVTAIAQGTSIITCKSVEKNTVIGTTTITVTPLPSSISVSKVTESEINKTLQLTATVLPANVVNKTVTWETSNTSVATVSISGMVSFKNVVGEVTITAKTTNNLTDNTGVISVYSVPTSVTITQQNQSLEVNKTLQLTATVLPTNARNKNVTWESATLGVATVSPTGLVTALTQGTSVITCKSVEKNTVLGTTTITVIPPLPTALTLSSSNDLENVVVGNTVNVTITPTPSNASGYTTNLVSDVDATINKVDELNYNVTLNTIGDTTLTANVVGSDVEKTLLINVKDVTPE